MLATCTGDIHLPYVIHSLKVTKYFCSFNILLLILVPLKSLIFHLYMIVINGFLTSSAFSSTAKKHIILVNIRGSD